MFGYTYITWICIFFVYSLWLYRAIYCWNALKLATWRDLVVEALRFRKLLLICDKIHFMSDNRARQSYGHIEYDCYSTQFIISQSTSRPMWNIFVMDWWKYQRLSLFCMEEKGTKKRGVSKWYIRKSQIVVKMYNFTSRIPLRYLPLLIKS